MLKGITIAEVARPCVECGTMTHRLVKGNPTCTACASKIPPIEPDSEPKPRKKRK